ncbi:transcriptional regulator, AraC family [Polaromonas sp. OV174]|uniref:helix-turn-helix transcriptional regulator n=1 Tax=Polaromonas sp. OV174 TaxID=1855300 RepID=UPI0008EB469E|nr:helix-turn-helix domain-containing protein [Polaromonas sp. OV174]SFB75831.1 transcriptional regulator, AraC family [Polaromonas sp. OV174]
MRDIKTYGMSERADHPDFDIRSQLVRPPLVRPHRHEYFQIQISLQGDTEQNVAGTVRPFRRGYLSFILPYRVHVIPHPEGSRYVIINMSQQFLRPGLDVDPLDLEDVPLSRAPELAPFLFQEYADFHFSEDEFPEIEALLEKLALENTQRRFGSVEMIRGLMLQLIALTCRKFEADLLRLSASQAQQGSRRASLQRAVRYIRDHLAGEITLTDAAAAAFLSPNYLAHLLKKETGKTFTDLVTERRLEFAQELLTHSSQRIASVAHASGFADEAYFSRRFRQRFGQTPKAYRDSVRAKISGAA